MPNPVFGERTVRGRVARLLTAALVLWLGALLAPASALAHAELIEVSPADGSRVEAAPATFSITFNEQVGLESDAVRIVDSTGRQVDLAPEVVAGSMVTQALPPLADGWYLATWTVTSADGHILNQASTFGVGAASDASRAAALALRSSTAPASWVMRFVADLTLLVAVGAAAAWALMSARSQRVQRLRRGSLAIAAIATLATIAIAERARPAQTPVPFDASQVPGGHWLPVALAPMPVSATAIRERATAGQGIAHLVPSGVAGYIDQHFLYQPT